MNYSNVEIRGNDNTVIVVQDNGYYHKDNSAFVFTIIVTVILGLCYSICLAVIKAIQFIASFIFKHLFFNSFLALGIFIIFCVIAVGIKAYKSI